jgi:hypothetical protein
MSFLARSVFAKIHTSRNTPLTLLRQSGGRSITTYAQLPEEHRMVYDMCRKFADEELAPNAGTWDKQHSFPTDAVKQLVRIPQQNLIPGPSRRHVGVHLTVLSSGGTWLDGNQRQSGARWI